MTNPKVKKGEKILILEVKNAQPEELVGQIVTVNSADSYNNITVKTEKLGTWSLYSTNNSDRWCYPTREARVTAAREVVEDLRKRLQAAQDELEFHEKYESEEEWLVDQIEKLTSGRSSKQKKIEVMKLITSRLRK